MWVIAETGEDATSGDSVGLARHADRAPRSGPQTGCCSLSVAPTARGMSAGRRGGGISVGDDALTPTVLFSIIGLRKYHDRKRVVCVLPRPTSHPNLQFKRL